MTVIRNLYPRPIVGPEPGVIAAYDFDPANLSLGRYLDKSGNGLDVTTRTGSPIVGQGQGIYVADDANAYWSRAALATGVALTADIEVRAAPAAARIVAQNGNHQLRVDAAGTLSASVDGATYSTTPATIVGYGPCRTTVYHDGANQIGMLNGRRFDADAAVLAVPAANLVYGRAGTTRASKVYFTQIANDAAERASYVRDFAKQVLFHWKPDDDGEGGIATGQTGHGWYAPVGGAGLSHVWRTDLSEPNGGHLALTGDTGSMARICFDFGRPFFGSWLITYTIRNPAFGADNPRIGFHNVRGADFTTTPGSYWIEASNTGGGWWRHRAYRDNSVAIGGGVDVDHAVPAAGAREAVLLTRTVSGDFRIYSFCRELGQWFWRAAAIGNDVTYLSTAHISIAPRGSYIESVTYYQGEITPSELETVL